MAVRNKRDHALRELSSEILQDYRAQGRETGKQAYSAGLQSIFILNFQSVANTDLQPWTSGFSLGGNLNISGNTQYYLAALPSYRTAASWSPSEAAPFRQGWIFNIAFFLSQVAYLPLQALGLWHLTQGKAEGEGCSKESVSDLPMCIWMTSDRANGTQQ